MIMFVYIGTRGLELNIKITSEKPSPELGSRLESPRPKGLDRRSFSK